MVKNCLWKGPQIDGVTQSLLGSFLVCRERFRIKVVEGLRSVDRFNHALEYGNMFHLCEEVFWSSGNPLVGLGNAPWRKALLRYCQELAKKYPLQNEEVSKWYHVCLVQFPIYVDYWKRKDKRKKRSIEQEEVFRVPYELPSGRIVELRGKRDAVYEIGRGTWLGEHKTKGQIDEQKLQNDLTFDLQTMFYLTAMTEEKDWDKSVKGVVYNVIRRPLSGGRGSIRQGKPTKSKPKGESDESYYNRLVEVIRDDPGYFFMRWDVKVTAADIEAFKGEFLEPILEQLWDWWEGVGLRTDSNHYRQPYGVYNPIALGLTTDVDEYLRTGSKVGLEKATTLFGELE